MSNTKIICFANNKGGSGKSTTCSNVAYGLTELGRKVLMVDGDTKKRRSLLPGNATGIQDRTATDTLSPGHFHHVIGKAGIDDGKNHFMIVSFHVILPFPVCCC